MVTEKDITNMGRKIKRSNNPKTLARYQAQIDAWIAELAQDQARTQADIRTLEEKIKLEEEARAAQTKGDNQYTKSLPLPGIGTLDTSKEVAVKIAEKAPGIGALETSKDPALPGIGRSDLPGRGAGRPKKEVALPGIATVDKKSVSLPGIPSDSTKKIAGPRKSYQYFEFERLHLRRSRF